MINEYTRAMEEDMGKQKTPHPHIKCDNCGFEFLTIKICDMKDLHDYLCIICFNSDLELD